MTTTEPAPSREALLPLHRRIPTHLWWALAIAVVAVPVGFTWRSETRVNGVTTQCSYLDVGALVAAVAVVGLVVAAWFTNGTRRRVQPRRYLAPGLLVAFSVPLLAAAAYHVVSGLGIVGGPCG